MLTAVLAVSMLQDHAPLLLDIILSAFRLLVFACNAAFMWESSQTWHRQAAARKAGKGGLSTAMDTELYLLTSCLLLLLWQGLHTCVSGGSVALLAVLVGVHAGGAALLRAFGAMLLLWAPCAQLPQHSEVHDIHSQLQAWWPPYLQRDGNQCASSSSKAQSARPPEPEFGAQYLAALATAAAKLLAPCTLSRAQTLQDISSCRASVSVLLEPSSSYSAAAVATRLHGLVRTPLPCTRMPGRSSCPLSPCQCLHPAQARSAESKRMRLPGRAQVLRTLE